MSGIFDFIVTCCRKSYLAKRYKAKPYLKGVLNEEFKMTTCVICEQKIIERTRTIRTKNGIRIKTARLTGNSAEFYLLGLDYKEVFNEEVQKGSKDLFNWFYGFMNRRYDLNDALRD